jgi:hypothetical protein
MSHTRGEQSVRGKCCVSRGTAPRLAGLGRTVGTPTIPRDVGLGILGQAAASGAPSASVRRSVSRQETTCSGTPAGSRKSRKLRTALRSVHRAVSERLLR